MIQYPAHLDMIEELARTGLTEARRSVTALRPQLLESGDRGALGGKPDESCYRYCSVTKNSGIAYPLPAEVNNLDWTRSTDQCD